MPFSRPLPTWNAVGTEPPLAKKNAGWGVDEKPPADYFNWIWNTTYLAMKEMQENALHSDRLGAANGIATLGTDGKVPASQLNIQAPTDASISVKGIVQLSSATNSTSEVLAATPKAVKTAYDLANGKYSKPTNGIPKADLESSVQTSLNRADTAEINAKNYTDSAIATSASKVATGTYIGGTGNNRLIAVGFTPKIVTITSFYGGKPVHIGILNGYQTGTSILNTESNTMTSMAYNDGNGNKYGITANGFYVSEYVQSLNQSGYTYQWTAQA